MQGYETYAELSLASKMAPSVESVVKLTDMLTATAYPAAQKELDSLRVCIYYIFQNQLYCILSQCIVSYLVMMFFRLWLPPFYAFFIFLSVILNLA
jgi:hypothetical protein